MDSEVEPYVAIWQKIMTAQRRWIKEIELRTGEKFRILDQDMYADIQYPGPDSRASDEVWEMHNAVLDVYQEIRVTLGDPRGTRAQYRHALDLYGRNPRDAIIEDGLLSDCIDMVLIGPEEIVVQMMASDPRILAAVHSRADKGDTDNQWIQRCRHLIARADSEIAMRQFNEVVNANLR